MSPRLRLFKDDEACTTSVSMVNVRLAEIIEPLLDAARSNRTFLNDFADDELQIPADLYDVLCAFRRVRISA